MHFERIKGQNAANKRKVGLKKVDGVKCLDFTHLALLSRSAADTDATFSLVK